MFIISLCIAWFIGIGLSNITHIGLTYWVVGCIISTIFSIVVRLISPREKTAVLWLAALLMLCAGGARHAALEVDNTVAKYNDNPRTVTVVGTVVDEPDVRDRSIKLRVDVETLTIRTLEQPNGVTEEVRGRILVNALRFPEYDYGDKIEITGQLETPFEIREFSYADFLAQEEIYSVINLPRIKCVIEASVDASELTETDTDTCEFDGSPIRRALFAFKQRSIVAVEQVVPPPESSLLKAVLFGDKSGMEQTLQDDFRATGVSHLIVVSGFHVAIVMLAVLKTLELFMSRRPASIITIVILCGYGMMVGGKPSVIRAVLMASAYLIAQAWFNRSLLSVGLLALVGLTMTLIDPRALFSVSFQLSFTATLGIILFYEPLESWAKNLLGNDLMSGIVGQFIKILLISTAAQILTLPLIAFHFKEISLITLITNLLVVPFQPLIVVLGIITTLFGMAFAPIGTLFGWIEWVFLTYTICVIETLARLPFAAVSAELPNYLPIVELNAPLVSLGFIYTIIGAISWYLLKSVEQKVILKAQLGAKLPRQALVGVSAVLAILSYSAYASQPDGRLHIHFFDVGQGDAALITTPSGRQILVDGGYYPSVIEGHLGRTLPFYDRSLDIVFATHPDADHITGLPGILERYDVDLMVISTRESDISPYYDELIEVAIVNDVERKRAIIGESIDIGDGVRLEILHPGRTLDEDKRNNNSVSFRLVYGDFTLLLTGDAERNAERQMVQENDAAALQSLVFKVGHHGSNTSSIPEFLDAVRPQIGIVSAGQDNKFGHPHDDVMCRLYKQGISVLDTRCHGTIELVTDGTQMEWWSHDGDDDPALSCNQQVDLAALCAAENSNQ